MTTFNKLRRPSKNHFILLLLCAVIGYLLRSHDTYELRPVWRKRAEYHHFDNKKYPKTAEQLPSPVITDLDSDGINEILLITNDLKLSVMTLPDREAVDSDDRTLPHVVVKHKTVLPMATNGSVEEPSGWPVVMATGFTTPYMSMVQVRHQVVVIVTNSSWVLCYSSSLQLMWTRQLHQVTEKLDQYNVKSMGVLVTSQVVRKTDQGMVIVGGSFSHASHEAVNEEVNENETETTVEPAVDGDAFTHFSTFALSAQDGDVRWHHLPGEFHDDKAKAQVSPTEHHWKLSLKRHRLHVGESPWTFYKQELYKTLPHLWRSVRDTTFTLGQYRKVVDETLYREEDEETASTTMAPKSALDPKHIIGYAYGGQRPHSLIEHIANPNAVVINHHAGIEVLNIQNGRPITRLPLADDGAIYTVLDAENDVKKLSWGEQENYSPCFLEVFRLFPLKENLERFPVCITHRLFFTNNWVYDEDMYQKLPPIVMPSIARKSGVVRHLLGHHLRKETDTYDMIVMGSMGRITSVDKNGDFNWQSQVSATWDSVAMNVRKMKRHEWSELKEEFLQSFRPDRTMMSLQVYGEKNNLLIVGWKDMSLIELTEGRNLAEHSVPCSPTGPLVVGDFNNDGYNDVIFTCKFGYIGFSLHRQSNHQYTVLYGLAVFLIIIVIAWLLSPESPVQTDSDDESSS